DWLPQRCIAGPYTAFLAAFRQGLKESGFAEAQNVAIEYRWAEGQHVRLSSLATELVRRQVAVIVCSGGNFSAPAAKAVTTNIQIVFARVATLSSLAWSPASTALAATSPA